jgi:hypothetical protein
MLMHSAYTRDGAGEDIVLMIIVEIGLVGLVFVAILTSLIFLFSKKSRLLGVRLMLFGVMLSVTIGMGIYSADKVRWAAIERFAKETEPLVVAIKGYELQHGAPPESLEHLVPGFLVAIPETGIPAAPRWEYSRDRWADGSFEWRLSAVEGVAQGEITYVPDPGCGSRGAKVTGGTWCYWPY